MLHMRLAWSEAKADVAQGASHVPDNRVTSKLDSLVQGPMSNIICLLLKVGWRPHSLTSRQSTDEDVWSYHGDKVTSLFSCGEK